MIMVWVILRTRCAPFDPSAAVADRKAVMDRRFAYSAGRTEMPLFVPFPFIPGSIERYNGS
ncbi:hypothetical protein JI735_04740 [Paenibacillus sonchi]|uniref:Uncharacterized protein n=1 Tax=Paenibacillus sonchi TaxID=373687 RepID=A0A974SDK7_9BACL|nr:hypothetical protein [Paenibacillus sonchi]QQZ61992.1 hypothetical protein JI735_04740 [Paenibacillus sonchi]